MKNTFSMQAEVWVYPGNGGWHFITLPEEKSAEIRERFGMMARGWGSLPVVVTIGKTSWKTSIFPDKKRGGYILPVKAEVRKKETVYAGDTIPFQLKIALG